MFLTITKTSNITVIYNICIIAVLCIPCISISANSTARADEIHIRNKEKVNEDMVYEYTLTDFNRAKEIMKKLRHEAKLPKYRLNMVEGDLYFNRGKYFEALQLYKRVYHDKSIEKNDSIQNEMLRRLIFCNDNIHNNNNMRYYANQLLLKSTANGNISMEAVALFALGKIEHFRGKKKEGIGKMMRAIELTHQSASRVKIDQLYYFYISLIEILQKDGDNRKGLSLLSRLEKILNSEKDESGKPINHLSDSRYKDIYAHYAVLLHRMGENEKAKEYYYCFLSIGNDELYDYDCIMPYMVSAGHNDKLISFANQRMNYLRQQDDTLGYDMTSAYESLANAYMAKGEYLKAANAFSILRKIVDNIRNTEEISAINELTSNYELHDKEIEMERKNARTIIISISVIALIIIAAISVIVFRTRRHNRLITYKNRAMAETIDDLMQYKQQLYEKERNELKKQPICVEEYQCDDDDCDTQRLLFERIRHELIENQLYLDCNLSRETLLERFKIPKNNFSVLFKHYAGTTYTKFINDQRLDHAVRLLHEQPNYTIEAIASESGINSVNTLYKLFSQKYGMTPNEYRTAHMNSM